MSLQRLEIGFGETELQSTEVTDTMVETLVSAIGLGITKDRGVSLLSGYINPISGKISESNKYVLENEGLHVGGTSFVEEYNMVLARSSMYEGESNLLRFTNPRTGSDVSLNSMNISLSHEIIKDTTLISEKEIRDSIKLDNKGVITSAEPSKNVSWTDMITISAYPKVLDDPKYTDADRESRTLRKTLSVRAIAVSIIEIIPNEEYYKEGQENYIFEISLLPDNNTKMAYATVGTVTWYAMYGEFVGKYYTAPTGKAKDYIYCEVSFMNGKITNELDPYEITIDAVILSDSLNPLVWNAVKTALELPDTTNVFTTGDCATVTNEQFPLILRQLNTINEPYSFSVGSGFNQVTSLTISNSSEAINNYCTEFELPNLTTLVDSIGAFCYNATRLKEIRLPKLTTITCTTNVDKKTFQSCTSLEEVNFPNLANLDFGGSSHDRSVYLFYGCTNLKTLRLPKLKTMTFSWSNLVGNYMFAQCISLETIDLSSVEEMGGGSLNNIYHEFKNDRMLKRLDFPSLKTINMYNRAVKMDLATFQGCTSLEEVNFPSIVTFSVQGGKLFKDLTNLKKVVFGVNLLTIRDMNEMFSGDTILSEDSQEYSFQDTSLTTISDGGSSWFSGVPSVLKLKFPSTLTTLPTTGDPLQGSNIGVVDLRFSRIITTIGSLFNNGPHLKFAHVLTQSPSTLTSAVGKFPIFVPKNSFASSYIKASVWQDYYYSDGYSLLRSKYVGMEECPWQFGGETKYKDAIVGDNYTWEDGTAHQECEYVCCLIGSRQNNGSDYILNVNKDPSRGATMIPFASDNYINTQGFHYPEGGRLLGYEADKYKLKLVPIGNGGYNVITKEGLYMSPTTNGQDSYSNFIVFKDEPHTWYKVDNTLVDTDGLYIWSEAAPFYGVARLFCIPVPNKLDYHYQAYFTNFYSDGDYVNVTQPMINQSRINYNRLFPDDMMDWMCKPIFGVDKTWEGDLEDIPNDTLYEIIQNDSL